MIFLVRQCIVLLVLALTTFSEQSLALRTGAPSLACVSLRPFHGLHTAKPASASQFFVSQSSFTYTLGQNTSVEIATHSSERYFRGFIVQAYDPITGQQIGHFEPTDDSRPLDSCSAATHKNNVNKKSVNLFWMPPLHPPARNAKRQLEMNNTTAPVALASAEPQVAPKTGVRQRQVRFRASIVVTYDEFYTGFESSDRRFDKWDYATSGAHGMPSAPITTS